MFFSPSLYHLALDLRIAPLVRILTISSNSSFKASRFSSMDSLRCCSKFKDSSSLSNRDIVFSRIACLVQVLRFFFRSKFFAYF